MRVHDLAHEGRDGHAGHRVRVLEGEEHAEARALVGLELEQVDALEADGSRGHLVGGMAHQDVRQGGLAGAVRAHDGVDLATRELEVDALEDLLAVDRGVEPLNLEVAHEVGAFRRTPGSGRTVRSAEECGADCASRQDTRDLAGKSRRSGLGAAICWTASTLPRRERMPDLGWQEILIVLVIALLVLGPAKLPGAARSAGKAHPGVQGRSRRPHRPRRSRRPAHARVNRSTTRSERLV